MTVTPAPADTERWISASQRVTWPHGMLIDGKIHESSSTNSWTPLSPRNGEALPSVASATDMEVDLAVAAAREAFNRHSSEPGAWSTLPPKERKHLLLRFADLIEEHQEELAVMISLEMGKAADEALNIELRAVLATYRWYAEAIDKQVDEIAPTDADHLALVTREPIGVVGVITPWNFPLTLSAWKIAPALAAGCTVVHKPSELTPFSALRIAELALAAGIPDGVLNVVTGLGPSVGRKLGEHPDVDALAFTGSTHVGRAFQHYSADSNLKRVWLELGGKSANIILPDAPDLETAIDVAAWGIFFNSGQMCTAPSRLIVHRDVADQVLSGLLDRANQYQPRDPLAAGTLMGPLASKERVRDVLSHVRNAEADGALLQTGGIPAAVIDGGSYFEPTIFTGVRPDSRLAQEEVFGPVLAMITVDNEQEAVTVANNSKYGLAAGLWTGSLTSAHRISRELRAGTVWINCYEEGDLSVPFGGYKLSGNGRDKSAHAIDKYTELKTSYFAL
ncbi:aldehyde dehydrogenase [Paenarthrobacter aromaticivorans]|uniref:aldehyde dehydrogenase n=1 Tax=Paenarthrobacter aromaticivorans TaxID=2849150 RepID=UPI003A7FAF21